MNSTVDQKTFLHSIKSFIKDLEAMPGYVQGGMFELIHHPEYTGEIGMYREADHFEMAYGLPRAPYEEYPLLPDGSISDRDALFAMCEVYTGAKWLRRIVAEYAQECDTCDANAGGSSSALEKLPKEIATKLKGNIALIQAIIALCSYQRDYGAEERWRSIESRLNNLPDTEPEIQYDNAYIRRLVDINRITENGEVLPVDIPPSEEIYD